MHSLRTSWYTYVHSKCPFYSFYCAGKSKEAERKRINKELGNIRSKFKGIWEILQEMKPGECMPNEIVKGRKWFKNLWLLTCYVKWPWPHQMMLLKLGKRSAKLVISYFMQHISHKFQIMHIYTYVASCFLSSRIATVISPKFYFFWSSILKRISSLPHTASMFRLSFWHSKNHVALIIWSSKII